MCLFTVFLRICLSIIVLKKVMYKKSGKNIIKKGKVLKPHNHVVVLDYKIVVQSA